MTEISETLCPGKNLPKNTQVSFSTHVSNSSSESQIGEGGVWHDEGDYYEDDDMHDDGWRILLL